MNGAVVIEQGSPVAIALRGFAKDLARQPGLHHHRLGIPIALEQHQPRGNLQASLVKHLQRCGLTAGAVARVAQHELDRIIAGFTADAVQEVVGATCDWRDDPATPGGG